MLYCKMVRCILCESGLGVARYICWSSVAGTGVCTRPHIDSNVNVREGMKSYNKIDVQSTTESSHYTET